MLVKGATVVNTMDADALAPSITGHGVDYTELTSACLPWGRISTLCAISVFRNDFRKCKHISTFHEINLAFQGLIFSCLLFQARAFFQSASSLAPHMYEPHYNFASLSDKVSALFLSALLLPLLNGEIGFTLFTCSFDCPLFSVFFWTHA